MPDSGGSIPQKNKKKHKTLFRNIKHCYFSITGNELIFNQLSVSKWCVCVSVCVCDRARVCVCVCPRARVRTCVYVHVICYCYCECSALPPYVNVETLCKCWQ